MAPLVTTLPVTTAEIEATVVTGDAADHRDALTVIPATRMPMLQVAATEIASARIGTAVVVPVVVPVVVVAETDATANGTATGVLDETIAVMMGAGHRDATATCLMTDAETDEKEETGATEVTEAIEVIEAAIEMPEETRIFLPRIAVVAAQPLRLRSASPPQT